jgi:hypothetical protein
VDGGNMLLCVGGMTERVGGLAACMIIANLLNEVTRTFFGISFVRYHRSQSNK